jgi:hypothetical protein
MNEEIMIQFLKIYSVGIACGIGLSVIPFVIGEIISFSLKLMKGG